MTCQTRRAFTQKLLGSRITGSLVKTIQAAEADPPRTWVHASAGVIPFGTKQAGRGWATCPRTVAAISADEATGTTGLGSRDSRMKFLNRLPVGQDWNRRPQTKEIL